ncbi:MAG: TolC family protein [Bacteroidetes bacterium]|jgi:outer membrane protein|nr:TolC family protein [Bacteroidota bacterium]
MKKTQPTKPSKFAPSHAIAFSMKIPSLLVAIITLIAPTTAKAQEKMDLAQCIALAKENNLVLEQARLGLEQSSVLVTSAREARYPNANAFIGNNYNFGRTIDPFTNAFVNQNVTAISTSLSSSATLFAGHRLRHNLFSALLNEKAGALHLEAVGNNVALDVTGLYMSALMAQEQVRVVESRMELTKYQRDQAAILVEAGASAEDRLLALDAQLASDGLMLTNAHNNLAAALLDLNSYIRPGTAPGIEPLPMGTELPKVETVSELELMGLLEDNFERQPQVTRDEILLMASEIDISSAKSGYLPQLNFTANINSLYSSRSQQAINPHDETFEIGFVEGSLEPVYSTRQVFDYTTPGFFNQMERNFGQSFGFSLSIPVYNRNQIDASVQLAQIENQRSYLQLQQTKIALQQDLYAAWLALEGAVKSFESAQTSKEAQERLVELNTTRFEAGAIGFFEYQTSINARTAADLEWARAKFELVFRQAVFDFYRGAYTER